MTKSTTQQKHNKKSSKKYLSSVVIWCDEVTYAAWEDYCDICGVPRDAKNITIRFDLKNVSYN